VELQQKKKMDKVCDSCGSIESHLYPTTVLDDETAGQVCSWCKNRRDEVSSESDEEDFADFSHIKKERWIRNMRVSRRQKSKNAMLKFRKGSSGCGGVDSICKSQTTNWCNCSIYCYNCPAPGKMKQGNKGHKKTKHSTIGHCTHMKPRLNSRLANSQMIKHALKYE
jgi:hypothetical protein